MATAPEGATITGGRTRQIGYGLWVGYCSPVVILFLGGHLLQRPQEYRGRRAMGLFCSVIGVMLLALVAMTAMALG